MRMLAWLRGDRPWTGRTREDWCILGYYLGCIVVGCVAIGADDLYQRSGYGDVWSIGIAVVGLAGVGAWLDRARRAEGVIICAIAALTLFHGGLLLAIGGTGSLQAGIRLAYAPLMMLPFAAHRAAQCLRVRDIIDTAMSLEDEDR